MKLRAKRFVFVGLFAGLSASSAFACSGTEPYLATVCTTAATFCPRGYLEADGRLLSIAQNTALFSLLGTNFGGDGRTTFGLPDLRSRTPVGASFSNPPGLTPVSLGEKSGAEQVTISLNQMPLHSHTAQMRGTASTGNTDSPAGAAPAKLARSNNYSTAGANTNMAANTVTVGTAGGSQPMAIRNPYTGLLFCIAAEGIFPSRP